MSDAVAVLLARQAIAGCGGLVCRRDFVEDWGVSRSYVDQFIKANPTFPDPVGRLGKVDAYLTLEVAVWLDNNGKPGRGKR